jgi:predicted RNA methylase
MTAQLHLIEGEARDPERSAWFTPPQVADKLVGWVATSYRGEPRILEPSAGNGALVLALARRRIPISSITAIEPDQTHWPALRKALARCLANGAVTDLAASDFLAYPAPTGRPYDWAIMNPPYERNQHVAHAERALEWATRVVGLFPAIMLHSQGRARFWRHVNIHRMAVLSERPRFGGEHQPMIDFLALELRRRKRARRQGEPTTTRVEWW